MKLPKFLVAKDCLDIIALDTMISVTLLSVDDANERWNEVCYLDDLRFPRRHGEPFTRERSDSFTIWLGHWFCAHHRMIVDCRSCSNVFFLPILLVVPISIHVVGLIRSGHQNSGTSFLGGCTEGVTLVY